MVTSPIGYYRRRACGVLLQLRDDPATTTATKDRQSTTRRSKASPIQASSTEDHRLSYKATEETLWQRLQSDRTSADGPVVLLRSSILQSTTSTATEDLHLIYYKVIQQ